MLLAQTDDWCGFAIVFLVLAYVGEAFLRLAERHAGLAHVLHRWVIGWATAIGFVVFVVGLFVRPAARDATPLEPLVTGVLSGALAGVVLAFVIPLLVLAYVHGLAPPFRVIGRCRKRAAERRARRREERERKRAQEQYKRSAPAREQAQRRRTDARASCELFYSLHAPEIGKRFPKGLFDDFVARHLGDDHPPEYVEQRAQQLQELLRQHLDRVGAPQKKLALADLAQWFLREKQEIDKAALPPADKEVLIAALEERYTKLQEKFIRGLQP